MRLKYRTHKRFRGGLFVFLLIAFLFLSCEEKPEGLLSKREMEEVLYDYHIAQYMASNLSFDERYKSHLYVEAVFEKHGITEAQFDSSLVYYNRHIDEISDMALEMLNDMDLDDEKVLDKFIEDNGIIVDVDDDGHTVITFNLDTTEILKKWTESDAEDAPRLSGAVTIDMEGAKIINYEYDLSSYFKYMLKQSFGEDAFTTLEVEIFSVIGGSLDYKPYMISAVNEFIEYGDDKAADFIADFDEHVLSDIVDA